MFSRRGTRGGLPDSLGRPSGQPVEFADPLHIRAPDPPTIARPTKIRPTSTAASPAYDSLSCSRSYIARKHSRPATTAGAGYDINLQSSEIRFSALWAVATAGSGPPTSRSVHDAVGATHTLVIEANAAFPRPFAGGVSQVRHARPSSGARIHPHRDSRAGDPEPAHTPWSPQFSNRSPTIAANVVQRLLALDGTAPAMRVMVAASELYNTRLCKHILASTSDCPFAEVYAARYDASARFAKSKKSRRQP